jgi:hypothetical protein
MLRLLASLLLAGSTVEGNVFRSQADPKIEVQIDQKVRYVGPVEFQIRAEAKGTRYVFVQADAKKHIERMFVVQQEGFLPGVVDTYKYPIRNPARLGEQDYQHSVGIYDDEQQIRENPGLEADLTRQFLESKGFHLERELVMSRFARPVGNDRRHEIIFFYFENRIAYSSEMDPTRIRERVDEHAKSAFQVRGG